MRSERIAAFGKKSEIGTDLAHARSRRSSTAPPVSNVSLVIIEPIAQGCSSAAAPMALNV